jgi:uncharacterized protein
MEKEPAELQKTERVLRAPWVGRLLIAAAVVGAAFVGGQSFSHWVDVRYRDGIVVSGSASRRIRSNRAIWVAWVPARGATVTEAYATLARDVPRVRQFLIDNHVPESDIAVESVVTEELYAHNEDGVELHEEIAGYELSQAVRVTSDNVDLVARVARDVTRLIESGVYVRSDAPEYIYTDLARVKIGLVGEATADARSRAEQVARNSGGGLDRLVSANVGVVQVNAADQTNVSWEGVYDRTSIDKDVMVAVRTMFQVQ